MYDPWRVERPRPPVPELTRDGIEQWRKLIHYIDNNVPYPKHSKSLNNAERLDYLTHKERFRTGVRTPTNNWIALAVFQYWARTGVPERVRQGM